MERSEARRVGFRKKPIVLGVGEGVLIVAPFCFWNRTIGYHTLATCTKIFPRGSRTYLSILISEAVMPVLCGYRLNLTYERITGKPEVIRTSEKFLELIGKFGP